MVCILPESKAEHRSARDLLVEGQARAGCGRGEEALGWVGRHIPRRQTRAGTLPEAGSPRPHEGEAAFLHGSLFSPFK